MRAMLQDALSRDECMTVMLQVRNENVLARRLYERLGFITLDGDSTQLYLMGKQGIRSAIARIHNQL